MTMITILEELMRRRPELAPCREAIAAAADRLVTALAAGRCLYTCGNGGSAADADHIVGELLKRFALPRPLPAPIAVALRADGDEGRYLADHLEMGLPAISLTGHPALATAMTNDVAGDLAFAQQLLALGEAGDVLLAISTSGNARNVRHALRVARVKRIVTIGLTGGSGGAMAPLCDVAIRVPSDLTPDIQELHLPIYHALCRMVEAHFFAKPAETIPPRGLTGS